MSVALSGWAARMATPVSAQFTCERGSGAGAERELRCVSEGVEPEGFGVGPGSALEKRDQGAGAPRAVSHAQVFGREGLNQRAISNFPTRGLLP